VVEVVPKAKLLLAFQVDFSVSETNLLEASCVIIVAGWVAGWV